MNKRVEKPEESCSKCSFSSCSMGCKMWRKYAEQEIARLEKELLKQERLLDEKLYIRFDDHLKIVTELNKEIARIKGISVEDIVTEVNHVWNCYDGQGVHNRALIKYIAKQIHELIQGGGK